MKYKKCEICDLKSARKNNTKRFFMAQFPTDELRCKEWVKMTGKEDLAFIPIEKLHQLKFVCGKHFANKDFNKMRTQLKKTAVPSIRLTGKPLPDEKLEGFPYHIFRDQLAAIEEVPSTCSLANSTNIKKETPMALDINCEKIYYECDIPRVEYSVDVSTSKKPIFVKDVSGIFSFPETKDESKKNEMIKESKALHVVRKRRPKPISKICNVQLSPRKKKLIRKLTKYKYRLKTVEQKLKKIDNINSKALKTMLLSARKNQNRSAQGKRWTESDKSLAIAMYKSPKLYRYIRQLIPLPSIRTLQNNGTLFNGTPLS